MESEKGHNYYGHIRRNSDEIRAIVLLITLICEGIHADLDWPQSWNIDMQGKNIHIQLPMVPKGRLPWNIDRIYQKKTSYS